MAASAVFAVAAMGAFAVAQTTEPTSVAQDAERRIRELQREADQLAQQTSTVLGELRKLEISRRLRAEQVAKADAELTMVNAALETTLARAQTLEAEVLASSQGVRERLVEMYKRGRSGYVRLLLAADDLQSLGRMSRAVTSMARLDRVRFDAHRRNVRAARAAAAELAEQQQAMRIARAEATKARLALDEAVANHNRQLDTLDARRDLAAQYVGELQAANAALDQRVAALGSGSPAVLPLAPFRGALAWPVAGPILSAFGRGPSRGNQTVSQSGVEIGAAEGTEVRAVHGGLVSFAAPFPGFGTLVILDHGGNNFTVYGHLQDARVTAEAPVERGTVVGAVGRAPGGQGALYFEVRIDGRAINPVQWLRPRP